MMEMVLVSDPNVVLMAPFVYQFLKKQDSSSSKEKKEFVDREVRQQEWKELKSLKQQREIRNWAGAASIADALIWERNGLIPERSFYPHDFDLLPSHKQRTLSIDIEAGESW